MASNKEVSVTSGGQSPVMATEDLPTESVTASAEDHSTRIQPNSSDAHDELLSKSETQETSTPIPPRGPARVDTTTALAQAQVPPPAPTSVPPATITRTTSSAIGPSSDKLAIAPVKEEEDAGPRLQLTLLLTNGARHPFMLDAKYLAKRSVEAQGNDPFNLSVYKLKELILREWRDEWEAKPTNPTYIRLISFGRLLDDKSALKDNRFNSEQSNVIHMTIKPQDFGDEDEGKGGKTSYGHPGEGPERRSPGCRCVVM